MRKYKPVELPLKEAPSELRATEATCPNCSDRHGTVIGRLGLRLVFRCAQCRVRYYRPTASVQLL